MGNQSRSQTPPLPLSSGTGNEILWDKEFLHDMRSKTGSPRILSWHNALSQSILLPIPTLDKGNEGSGNEIGGSAAHSKVHMCRFDSLLTVLAALAMGSGNWCVRRASIAVKEHRAAVNRMKKGSSFLG